MKPSSLRLLFSCILTVTLGCGAFAAEKPRVLIVTGDDVTPAHNWQEVSAATRDILVNSGKFDVVLVTNTAPFSSATELARYDAVLLAMYNAKTPTLTDTAKENLLNYVRSGKGFVVTHLSSASFKEWPEFRKLCGRVWVMGTSGHGPRGKFTVKVADPADPIVKGLTEFEADDELYAKLQGDTPIKVLLEAWSDWSKQTEPLAFTLSYGNGRVFHHTFGHDGRALDNPSVRTVIVRGTEWAATGQVK
ncbi:MAG: ThuA domain-containing protein [Verrucomicrobia bacterium]|jgi:type 1 glutamine amidotransferase|nr:ThuA domain-containing protein [Verrucomicrobiota bacterium]